MDGGNGRASPGTGAVDEITEERIRGLFADWRDTAVDARGGTANARLAALRDCCIRTRATLGRAAWAESQKWMIAALAATTGERTDAPPRQLLAEVWEQFVRVHRPTRLVAEWRDQHGRDEAVRAYRRRSERATAMREPAEDDYLATWQKRIGKLVAYRRGPLRLGVRGVAPEEMRDQLVLALVEALADPKRFEPHERPGVEASLRLVLRARDEMRRREIATVPDNDADAVAVEETSPEDLYVAAETSRAAREALDTMVARLTPVQRQWFEAAREQLNSEERFHQAAVAQRLGRSRAEATRQFEALRGVLRAVGVER